MKSYDLAISFGPACSCTQALREAGLQYLSFPFDWVGPDTRTPKFYEADIRRRADFHAAEFRDWFQLRDFEHIPPTMAHTHEPYYNHALELLFIHDVKLGDRLEDCFDRILKRYQKRIARLMELIRQSKRVLILRVERPEQPFVPPVADSVYAIETLQRHFPGVTFEVLQFVEDRNLPFADCRVEEPAPGVTRVIGDYRDRKPGAPDYAPDFGLIVPFLRAYCTVPDYRTKAEKKAYHQMQQLRKWRAYGAETHFQYRLYKLRERLRTWAHAGELVPARLRRKKFPQIVMLGVNCETAFRFYCTWHFLDSSLFAWAQSFDLETLTSAIRHLGDLFAGEMTFLADSKMWQCRNTRIGLHGRFDSDVNAPPPPPEEIEKDRQDLLGRVAHLKEKFLRYARNGERTLFVHRLAEKDATSPQLGERLAALVSALEALGSQNYTLLVICERRHRARMPKLANVIYRTVRCFNPPETVTKAELGDPFGWQAVFSEFAPARILAKKHDFKFERHS